MHSSYMTSSQDREDYSIIFPLPSIASYTFIQMSKLGCHGENVNAQFETVAKGIQSQALSIASPAFYC